MTMLTVFRVYTPEICVKSVENCLTIVERPMDVFQVLTCPSYYLVDISLETALT